MVGLWDVPLVLGVCYLHTYHYSVPSLSQGDTSYLSSSRSPHTLDKSDSDLAVDSSMTDILPTDANVAEDDLLSQWRADEMLNGF